MMAHQLDDVVARGEAIAILNASEAGIYSRFGYGLAQLFQSWQFDTVRSAFRFPVDESLRLRLVPKADVARARASHLRGVANDARRRPQPVRRVVGTLFGDFESWAAAARRSSSCASPVPTRITAAGS